MTEMTRKQKIEAAHLAAMKSNDTLVANWQDRPKPDKRRKVRSRRTGLFVVARNFKPGHGRYS